jgi:hypothetical protein
MWNLRVLLIHDGLPILLLRVLLVLYKCPIAHYTCPIAQTHLEASLRGFAYRWVHCT